jgi:hypothetical protein
LELYRSLNTQAANISARAYTRALLAEGSTSKASKACRTEHKERKKKGNVHVKQEKHCLALLVRKASKALSCAPYSCAPYTSKASKELYESTCHTAHKERKKSKCTAKHVVQH